MRSTIRCAVCSSCLTVLASPDSAGGGIDRARVVSARCAVFIFFKITVPISAIYSYVGIDTYQSKSERVKACKKQSSQAVTSLAVCISGRCFESH